MSNLKVIQIVDSSNVGGTEVLAVNISNALVDRNVESHLCVTRQEGALKSMTLDSVGYIFLNKKSTLDLKAILKLRRYIKKHEIDILHAHSSSYFIATCIKILIPRVRIIWHDHYGKSEFLKKGSRFSIIVCSVFFRGVIAVNSKLLSWCKENLFVRNCQYLQNFPVFIDLKETTTLSGKEGKRVVQIAGFRDQKDHLTSLKGFKRAIETHPEWTLHLIGKTYNDAYYKKVLDYISNNHLNNRVFLYGLRTDIKHIVSQSSIGVLSSKSEGLPISLLEYGLGRLPVVVTNVGECGRVVRDGHVLVPAEDPEAFSKALSYLIENEGERHRISNDFSQLVAKEYTLDAFLDKLIEIYTEK